MHSTASVLTAITIFAAVASAQSTQRVSVNSQGVAAMFGPSSRPAISADGRVVAFESYADNLVPGGHSGLPRIYVHDRSTMQTTMVSVSSTGVVANGYSEGCAISADGLVVAYMSRSDNLAPGDTNGLDDVYVHDRSTGSTTCASNGLAGLPGNNRSGYPALSADGRYVALVSEASNLVSGDTNARDDVFVYDRSTGVTTRESVSTSGVQSNGFSPLSPIIALSADGRFVAFANTATNLDAADTNARADVFVRDRIAGVTERVSLGAGGIQGDGDSMRASISADGRHVAFASIASNLVLGDSNGAADLFVRDRFLHTTERVSIGASGVEQNPGGSIYGLWFQISADGRVVAFQSEAANLVADDTNGSIDVFVRDRQAAKTERVSVSSTGTQGNSHGSWPSISADGRCVAFTSASSNLIAGDVNGQQDVFVRDWLGAEPPVAYCTGDGSGTPCPCGNVGSIWRGCENTQWTGGAQLLGSGAASVSADSFVLEASHLPAATTVQFVQAAQRLGTGVGAPFGDGLRCLDGLVVRLGRKSAVSGSARFGAPAGDAPISEIGTVQPLGGVLHYQALYRSANASCGAGLFNATNALAVRWTP